MKKFFIFVFLFIAGVFVFLLYFFHILVSKYYYNEDFGIDTYVSNVDKDDDGVDDQSDILNNALDYIGTRPKYKSKYYQGGYPDDGYGVCTDVVGYALLHSGYDLRELVNEDIINNRNQYHIDIIDKDIDFRRVANLDIYFHNNAITITTSIDDIGKWQGGDIVVFHKHIGIISNKRNKKGIPLVIHHYGVLQNNYEEDILESKKDEIIGHYRVS